MIALRSGWSSSVCHYLVDSCQHGFGKAECDLLHGVIAHWRATSLAGFGHLDHAEIITYPNAPSL